MSWVKFRYYPSLYNSILIGISVILWDDCYQSLWHRYFQKSLFNNLPHNLSFRYLNAHPINFLHSPDFIIKLCLFIWVISLIWKWKRWKNLFFFTLTENNNVISEYEYNRTPYLMTGKMVLGLSRAMERTTNLSMNFS